MCYAYLSDVDIQTTQMHHKFNSGESVVQHQKGFTQESTTTHDDTLRSLLAKSRWFSRGWTLQELLAPSKEIFFAKDWTQLGDRNHMAIWISDITRIHIRALRDRSTIWNFSIAQRMSWAANRLTTRIEDIAYCLLGVFDIHMFMLYREGAKAFKRLQEELIRSSDDQSILAWEQLVNGPQDLHSNAFAPSPSHFECCGSVTRTRRGWRALGSPYSLTNFGVSIRLPIIKTRESGMVMAGLNCGRHLRKRGYNTDFDPESDHRYFGTWIPLRHIAGYKFYRAHIPSSSVFLEESYPSIVNATQIDLFISATGSDTQYKPNLMSELRLLRSSSEPRPSGFLVVIGSGKLDPQIQLYEEARTLDSLVILTIKSRPRLGVSHEIVHHAGFTVILSAAWSLTHGPHSIQSTAIMDSGGDTARQVLQDPRWTEVFDATPIRQTSNAGTNLDVLHASLPGSQEKCDDAVPSIYIEKEILIDANNNPVIISHINFNGR